MEHDVTCADFRVALGDGGRTVLVTAGDVAAQPRGVVHLAFTEVSSVRLVHWDAVAWADPAARSARELQETWTLTADEIGTLEVRAGRVEPV